MKHPRILASLILVGLTLSQPFAAPMPLEALNDTTAYHDLKGLYAKAQHYFKQNKFDSAALYFDDANQLANENAFTDEKLIHEIKNGYGITLAYLRQNMKSIEIFKELNSFYRENNSEGKYNKELAKTFNNIAINYNFIFDLEQAVRYFDSSLVYFRKENLLFADETRRAHYNKALNFLDMGNYQAAIENVELARFNRVKDSGDDKLSYERMSENLIFSEVLIEMNQGPHELREALTYLNEAYDILMKTSPRDYYVPSVLGLQSKAHLLLTNYDSALFYSRKIFALYNELYGPSYPGLVFRNREHGRIFKALDKPDSAMHYFRMTVDFPAAVDVSRNFYKVDARMEIAEIHLQQNNPDSAISGLLKATHALFPSDQSTNYFENPSPESIPLDPFISIFFSKKAEILYSAFQKTDSVEYLKAALDAYMLGINEALKSRKSLVTIRSKAIYSKQFNNHFDRAIAMASDLYNRDQSSENFRKLLWISDQSKSATLKDMLKKESNSRLGLPEELIAREMDLKTQINFLEQTIYKSGITRKIQSGNEDEMETQKLIEAKAELTELTAALRTTHPRYYNLMYGQDEKYGTEYFERLVMRNKNLEDYLIIDYFESEDKIYAQYVKGKKSGVLSVPKTPELKASVARFKECLNNKNDVDYQSEAYFIYQQILEPILESVKTKSIVIIPDGILSYFPFDLLVDGVIEERTNYKDFRYLIRTYNISYQHALSLVKEKSKPTLTGNSMLLAFAPDFGMTDITAATLSDNTRNSIGKLGSLPYARKEVEYISGKFDGQFLYDENASETNLKRMAKEADIIHLATHSIINDQNPMMSQLILSADTENDGLLHTYELFDLELNADLICLSACNSGFGELQKGEGMISLARGFLYANAKNILMSLWAVPDRSSSELMNLFYDEVKNDVSYELAIRNAKLEYLQAADNNLSHPYYWGAFVYVGDVEARKANWLSGIGVLILVAALLVVIVMLAKRVRDKKLV